MATLRRTVLDLPKFCYTFGKRFSFSQATRTFSCGSTLFADRLYTDKHEWITVKGSIGTVGISNYAQDKLGEIVYVQLPDVGGLYEQDDECGALESVKAASEIYCPVSGTVTETNKEAEDSPAVVNKSCYEKGWLFKIELSKPDETKGLMNEEAYDKYLKEQDE